MKELMNILILSQADLKFLLYEYLRKIGMKTVCNDGYLYAEGDIPILLVAHMDTFFEIPPKNIKYSIIGDKLYAPNYAIGGDDRCGVYAIMQLLKKFKPHVLFTEDEEIGCIGAYKAVERLPRPNVKYIIEFDRMGSDDCVFYDCGNEEFMNYIESFGFKTDYGTCSDISILGREWDIAAVNLSSGYYNEHTTGEFIIFNQLQKTIKRAVKMIKDYKNAQYFDYQEKYYNGGYGYSQDYNLSDDLLERDFWFWLGKNDIFENYYTEQEIQYPQQDSKHQEEDKNLVLKKRKRNNIINRG